MKNSEYWKQRFTQLNDALFRKSESVVKNLEKEYLKAQVEINKDIELWLHRIADNNELSLHEAKKLLKANELKEFHWDVSEYIRKGEENALDQRWMKQLENASARVHINRLEAMQLQIRHNLEMLAAHQNKSMAELNKELLSEGYYQTIYEVQKGIGQGYQFSLLQPERINTIAAKPWALDGKNFSSRIWESKEKLINDLQSNLTQAFIRGQAPDKTIKTLSERFGVSRRQSGRLVMTESAYFAAEGQRQAYKELDIERYEIVATLDTHTSELCQSLDGKIIDMKDYQPGLTAPPFHPFCRTVTCPYFEDNYTERAARGLEGEVYTVPGDMKYPQWKDRYITKETEKRYKTLLGSTTAKGTKIRGISKHLIDRAIQRDVSAESARNALLNPLKVGKIRVNENGRSQTYTGESARVTINPDTGNIITVWKTGSKLKSKLKGKG